MSPHVNNFVTDLVEMAKAMDELPKVQADNKALNLECERLAQTVQDRELRIIDLKNSVDEKLALIRTLEVARDDAELRFLELDEKASKVVLRLSHIGTDISAALEKLMETKDSLLPPEPVPTTPPTVGDQDMGHGSSSDQGSSASPLPQSETSSWATPTPNTTADVVSPIAHVAAIETANASNPASGQSEADPTLTQNEQSSGNGMAETGQSSSSSGKYSNKLYADWQYYVPLDRWLAEGGTEYSYNYRHPVDKINPSF